MPPNFARLRPVADASDAFLDGAVRLRQPTQGHRVGTDAVLLAAAVADPLGMLIDAGAGVGAVGLMMAQRAPLLRAALLEIDPMTAALARDNVALNGMSDRVNVIEVDILSASSRRAAGLADASADIVVANPPWMAAARSRASPDARRALAHVLGPEGLAGWMRAVMALTKPDGRMAIIVRGEDLADLLKACAGRFGGLAIVPVHPRAGAPALRLIAVGRKGSRAAACVMPGLVLHEADGRLTPQADALHRGRATLDIA